MGNPYCIRQHSEEQAGHTTFWMLAENKISNRKKGKPLQVNPQTKTIISTY